MKIALTGKGGVGKSSIAAAFALLLARRGVRVLALDADPDANLAAALGMPQEQQREIIPIAEHRALIEERTGAKVRQYGQIFKLNPEVSDIADTFAVSYNGVSLLVIGAIEKGGSGCACPENVLVKSLVSDLIVYKNDAVIMDMEAGVEHLGRATAKSVDTMVIVTEPGQNSIDSTRRILQLAKDIGMHQCVLVGNKIDGEEDERFVRDAFDTMPLIGMIPYSHSIKRSDRDGVSVMDALDSGLEEKLETILQSVVEHATHHSNREA
jgi:CO dehydrogenase maturation factor